jgi:hypothetical protein
MAFEARKHPARARQRSWKTHSKLGHRKQRQVALIGDRSCDIEDARLHNLHASLSAEAKQNQANSKRSTLNAEPTIDSRTNPQALVALTAPKRNP